jgi:hypothetical protein
MDFSPSVLYSHLLADLSGHIDTSLKIPGWSIDSTVKEVACYSLRDSFLKKFNQDDQPSQEACRAASEKFEAVNTRCSTWSLNLESTYDEWLVNAVKAEIDRFWFVGGVSPLVSDYREVYLRGGVGPGANISARDTDFYTKMFDSPLSCTAGIPEIWERCVSMSTLSFEAEASRAGHGFDVVDCSKYSFVNKTSTVARGICTEPTLNMWFQKGVASALESRLKRFWRIDLSVQPELNGWLARAGSIDGDLCTIDLESASDSMGLSMLRYMLPRSFMAVLEAFRCPKTRLPTGRELRLGMVSTMGNGYTFPLETMFFAAVVRGVASVVGCKLNDTNFGVFGDDIICPSKLYRTVVRVLSILGFSVNLSKSFVEGPFRESCGADFFKGVNVRGVYIKQLRTKQDFLVAVNSLNYWTAMSGVFLNLTVGYLMEFTGPPRPVPLDEALDAGLHTPSMYLPMHMKTLKGCTRYSIWAPREYAFYILGGCVWTFKDQVRRSYNPAGLYISLLAGGIRGCRVLLRQRRLRYSTKLKKTPRWDFLPPDDLRALRGPEAFMRFVDAWHWNLLGSCAFGSTPIS